MTTTPTAARLVLSDTTDETPTVNRDPLALLRALVELRPNGETRPQQETMVGAVADAIHDEHHLAIQAGTGVGKSLGYLVPAIASGKRVVVATATKQLSEQISKEDLPLLAKNLPKVGGPKFTYALLKGRSNYLCKRKVGELVRLDGDAPATATADVADALFDMPAETAPSRPTPADLQRLNSLLKWADETRTGDRTDAPACSDKVWSEVSTDSAGCPGAAACEFGDGCFAEEARSWAREADIVVTNHALAAQDLRSDGHTLGEWDVLVFDESHEVENYLSSAWGVEITPNSFKHTIASAARKLPRADSASTAREAAKSAVEDVDALGEMLDAEKGGLLPEMPEPIDALLESISNKLHTVHGELLRAAERAKDHSADLKGAAGKIAEALQAIVQIRMRSDNDVRWLEDPYQRSNSLRSAPLWVGPSLMQAVGDRTLIATSATITIGGTFDAAVRTFGFGETVLDDDMRPFTPEYRTVDAGTPFDYDNQAMLYIPGAGFPEPVGQNREAHKAAVLDDLVAVVAAAGGRTLALFTSRKAAEEAAEHLRTHITTPVLVQGEAPPAQLLESFESDEASTLCATMGFWHGVDVVGPSLSVVVMDKIPFGRMDDPLMSARRAAADEAGRRGFDEIYVANAAIMLTQGFGRLVRSARDRGVVAVLDPRLRSKGYGKTMLRSLPQCRSFADRSVIEGALLRLTGTEAGSTLAPQAPARTAAPSARSTRGRGRSGSRFGR